MLRNKEKNLNFESICNFVDGLRGTLDVGVLGAEVASHVKDKRSSPLLAVATMEGLYSLFVCFFLLLKWRDKNQTHCLDYATLFRLLTVIISAAASYLIFSDLDFKDGNNKAEIGILLATFSIFGSRTVSAAINALASKDNEDLEKHEEKKNTF